MAAGMQPHLAQQRAGGGLTLGERHRRGLGLARPAGELVADALELAEIEQPRSAGPDGVTGAGRLRGAPPLEGAHDRSRQLGLEARDLRP